MPDYKKLSDDELVARCIAKDADAWEALVRRYQRLIASITAKFRLDSEDADDVMQSVWLITYQQLPQLRHQAKLGAWLITITVRECWKYRDRRDKTDLLDDSEWEQVAEQMGEGGDLPESETLKLERQQMVRRAIAQLSERCRDLINYLFYRDTPTSYVDISRRMRIPIPSIGPTRMRCLEKLKDILQKSGFQ